MVLAEAAQRLAHDLGIHGPCGHGTRLDGRPRLRIAGRVEREDVIEGPSRGVSLAKRGAEAPGLSQRGDQ